MPTSSAAPAPPAPAAAAAAPAASIPTVSSASISYETDVPPAGLATHRSGVLHGRGPRSRPSCAWVSDSSSVEAAASRLEASGHDRSGMVFVPYSSREAWLAAYPHAPIEFDVDGDGTLIVPVLAAVGGAAGADGAMPLDDAAPAGKAAEASPRERARKRRRNPANVFRDPALLTDAERDELHVAMYKYVRWLGGKFDGIEAERAAAGGKTPEGDEFAAPPAAAEDGLDDGPPLLPPALPDGLAAADDDGAIPPPPEGTPVKSEGGAPASAPASSARRRNRRAPAGGVNTPALAGLLGKFEEAFLVIPNLTAGSGSDAAGDGKGGDAPLPFLETSLRDGLHALVAAREESGLPRRSRRQQRVADGGKSGRKRRRKLPPVDFDTIFERLKEFKEVNGHCNVQKSYSDQQLANFVRGIRERKSTLARSGVEFEELGPDEQPLTRTVTRERYDKLNSIGFQWTISGPKVAWDDRFKELMDYYNTNGKWPSQSMGSLGEWVHKQRTLHSKGDKNYMKKNFPRLDAVGFEWTPRGNTRMSWEEGYDLLTAYGRLNGHFNVPDPADIAGPAGVDRKSNDFRLFKWVESLHGMYRSYRLGRKSGSLTEDRVNVLSKIGFPFREE